MTWLSKNENCPGKIFNGPNKLSYCRKTLWFIDCLKDGLHNITENLNNPTSCWNGCNSGTLNSLSEVLNHVESEQTFQEDQSASAPNDNNITGNVHRINAIQNFPKKILLQKHLRKQHTGQESNIFIKYLIQDQAKALIIPSKQMRLYSLGIKYCLAKRVWRYQRGNQKP